ncbi:MAG: hypothetical protein KIT84_24730 [Labilithrix sp.]|nr:hypothetical protein [Labilithrix sp.]MCW5814256.1 hypothetical protein [Labilithrix sp.]
MLRTLAAALVLVALAASACTSGGSDEARGLHACNPLVADTKPIALGAVVAGGRAGDGTVYLVDRGPAGPSEQLRVFIGGAGGVRREKVAGSGGGSDFIALMVGDATSDLQVRIDLAGGAATTMAVFRGAPDPATKSFDPSSQGETLTLLSPSEIAALAVENIPAQVTVEYDATTPDGRRFVLLRPDVDWSYEDFRVFFGPPSAAIERKVTNASRGSSTYLTFDVDGVPHHAYLPTQFSSRNLGAPNLAADDGSRHELRYLVPNVEFDPAAEGVAPWAHQRTTPAPEPAAGVTFQCL